ncbi:MAG TPA: hypothetical protein VGM38_06925 [Pseudolysinimonas sp.]
MSFLATTIGTKVAVAAVALVALGGGTAAAGADLTLVGHERPASSPSPTSSGTPSESDSTDDPAIESTPSPSATHGPDAAGPAAFGLCTAFTAGGLNTHSVAYAALLTAAGSASVADYCAPILTAGHHATTDPSSTNTKSQGASHRSDHSHESGSSTSHRP